MEGDAVEEQQVEQSVDSQQKDSGGWRPSKRLLFWVLGAVAVVVVVCIVAYLVVPKAAEVSWLSNRMIALYIAIGVIGGGVAACFLLRKILRTRLRMQKAIREDPDINDWLVVFDWTPKILYVPTIIASFIAALLSWMFASIPPAVIGGAWFAIFLLNFLVEEYNISMKVVLVVLASFGFFLLWLHLGGWVGSFFGLFRHIAISMNATVYLLVGVVGTCAILISWLRGLFYYVSITPNYMNIQEGPTESGEQVGREDYNSRVDTSDFLERLMGFGRIVITFKDQKRQPITLLVWRIQRKAALLEKVRAKFAIDHLQQSQGPVSN